MPPLLLINIQQFPKELLVLFLEQNTTGVAFEPGGRATILVTIRTPPDVFMPSRLAASTLIFDYMAEHLCVPQLAPVPPLRETRVLPAAFELLVHAEVEWR